MAKLIFTDRKTSAEEARKEAKGIRNLFGRKSIIIEYAKYVITGIIMGVGSFMVFKTQFGLTRGGGWFEGGFTGGMVQTWNQIAETLAGKEGVFLDQLEDASDSSGLFLTIALAFAIALGILIARSRNRWFVLIYPLLFLPVTIAFGLSASVLSMAVLALGIVAFLAVCPGRKESSACWRWSRMAYALAATGLALIIICVPVVAHLADKPDSIQKIDDKASKSVATSYYGESPLGEGDLTIGKRRPGKGVAMTVTMSSPQSMYLRGYVGDVLDGLHWETLPYSSYYETRDLIYWLNEYGFNGLGQLGQAATLTGYEQFGSSDVDIEVDKASRKYAYVPYEISEDGVDDVKNWNDSFVTAPRGARLKEYSYSMGPSVTGKWTNVAGKLFTMAENADITSYLELESYYNSYVYESYLYISDEDNEALEMYFGDKGDQRRGHLEYNTAIRMVKGAIMSYMTYDKNPGKLRGKRSAVNSMLSAGIGYDTHFATLATMLFRYYGIPARYVEGYLITPQDVWEHPDGTFEVKQSAAHAWTEIYVDGVGFVPIETCPEFTGMMEEADYNVGISNKSVDDNYDDNQAEGMEPEDNYRDKDKGVGEKASRILMIIGGLIALALLVLLGIIIGRLIRKKLRLKKRKNAFKTDEPREAVRDMYRYMDEIGYPSDETTTEIGNRASYSTHSVTDQDRRVMLAVLSSAKKQIRAEKKRQKEADKRARAIDKAARKAEKAKDAERAKAAGKLKKVGKLRKNEKKAGETPAAGVKSDGTPAAGAAGAVGGIAGKAGKKFRKILPKRSGEKKGKNTKKEN